MNLDPAAILQEIVDHDGECETWASPAICKNCPLGNKYLNGRRVSCIDYIRSLRNLSYGDERLDTAYKEVAEEELFARELEKFLE